MYIVLRPSPPPPATAPSRTRRRRWRRRTRQGGRPHLQEVNIGEHALLRLMVMGKKSLPDPAAKRSSPYLGLRRARHHHINHVKDALKQGGGGGGTMGLGALENRLVSTR
uniref:Uncharacterized protein n=1 Tax=Oryza barthii TaxID=65489 RepID=A0A0D3F0K7_9ORYZ